METQCCVFTRGEFFIRDSLLNCQSGEAPSLFCDNSTFKPLGNISNGIIEVSSQVIGKENFFNPAIAKSRLEISSTNFVVTLTCANDENIMRSLLAIATEPDSGSFVEEMCISDSIKSGELLPFSKKGVESVTVYLTNAFDPPLLVDPSKYIFDSSALRIVEDIDATGYDNVRLVYDYDSSDYVEFNPFIQEPKYVEVYFKGFNMAGDENTVFDAQFYKVLFSIQNSTDLISKDEFITFSLVGSVEETTKGFFKIFKRG